MRRNELIERKAVFYPGYDKDMNIIAVPLGNTIIAGKTGAGKTILLNNLIKNAIEFNRADAITISIWSGVERNVDIWHPKKNKKITAERYIPHIGLLAYDESLGDYSASEFNLDEGMSEEVYRELLKPMSREMFLEEIYKEIISRKQCLQDMYNCSTFEDYKKTYSNNMHMNQHIVFMDGFDMTYSDDEFLCEILSESEAVGVYFVLAAQPSRCMNAKLLDYISNTFVLPMNEVDTAYFLDTDGITLPSYGYGICKREDKEETTLISIPFLPNSFLQKFVGSYSVRYQA